MLTFGLSKGSSVKVARQILLESQIVHGDDNVPDN